MCQSCCHPVVFNGSPALYTIILSHLLRRLIFSTVWQPCFLVSFHLHISIEGEGGEGRGGKGEKYARLGLGKREILGKVKKRKFAKKKKHLSTHIPLQSSKSPPKIKEYCFFFFRGKNTRLELRAFIQLPPSPPSLLKYAPLFSFSLFFFFFGCGWKEGRGGGWCSGFSSRL